MALLRFFSVGLPHSEYGSKSRNELDIAGAVFCPRALHFCGEAAAKTGSLVRIQHCPGLAITTPVLHALVLWITAVVPLTVP